MADETPTPDETIEAPEAATPEAPAAEAAAPAEPVVPLTPKERKAASRARRGTRRPATPEARAEARKAKAAARTRRRLQEREKAKAARPSEPVPDQEPRPRVAGSAKVRTGTVVSSKADKTITVRIDTARRHRKYEKIVRSSSTIHAHDETNDAGEGDLVKVLEARPLSRTKRWRLVEIMERAK
jgi:small subunit ribosomal protein S17